MNSPAKCKTCGCEISAGALDGLCPDCLGKLALGDPVANSPALAPTKLAATDTAPGAGGEQPGDRIGNYRLLQKIGEGGFGVVYMAEQEQPIRRRVALKVIKLGMDTRQVVARFEAERQALALMDHTNIARVLDAGATNAGRPYFVMELVKGIAITKYCDQNHLSLDERLGLFLQICQAMQHAHQKGIIHRDIKPSNVMVTMHDGVPVPKVIDFGIAKATEMRLTDKTLFTQYEQFMGTPAYMSPEQAEMTGLDIDTRSDIYSLGVLLYELLTGRPPFSNQDLVERGIEEARRTIREVEPPRPSTRLSQSLVAADVRRLSSKSEILPQGGTKSEIDGASSRRLLQMKETIARLRGDLDWIVMKCLEKDRTRRYDTANGLGMDVQRYLNQEAIVARPPSKVYQFRKLVRRNKTAFAAAALVLAALLAGLGLSTLRERTLPTPTPPPASVFVLPFRNAETNRVGTGLRARLTDGFINSLKLIDGVTVAPRRSALAKLPEAEARAEAARLFGVRYVLGGAMNDVNSLTLSLALHEIGRDRPVWTQAFTGDTNRVIELEEQAIGTIAAALKTPITPDTAQRINQVLTNNLEAWRLMRQAESEMRAGDRESWNLALQHYNDALLLDPDYLGGMAAKAQFLRQNSTDRSPNDIWPEIKGLAARMLQIDPTEWAGQYFAWLPQFLYDWDWAAAEKTFQERRARNADWPVMTAIYLRTVGRLDEARAEQEKVKGLDQTDSAVRVHSMGAALVERDYRRALELARETRAMHPETLWGWDALFHAYYHLGEFEPALEAIRKLRQASGDPMFVALEGCALAKMGQTETARKMLADREARSADRYVDAYPLAWLHLALGDRRGALAKLRKACEQRSELVVFPDYPAGLRTDPKLDELRNEPEFQELLKLAGMDVWPKPALGK